MAMDWKDALMGIREELPEGEEPAVENAAEDAAAPSRKLGAGKNGKINVVVERKGRKGKTATIAEGFLCSDEELEELASRAKRHLGTGGSARGGEILIQGECRDRLMAFLRSEGYKV